MNRRFLAATALAAVVFLIAAPAADALEIGARSVKARPSREFSPHTAWDQGVYGCNVTIAVFDEGVDDGHPSLAGKVIAGFDSTASRPAQELVFPNPQPLRGSHGTPVAGLAASHGGKPFFRAEDAPTWADTDLVGVAPCAWLVDVMFNDLPMDPTPLAERMIAAFEWAVEHKDDPWGDADPTNDGIEIITVSWSPNDGTDGSDALSQAVNKAVEAGIVVLGSMGNSGPDYQPWGTPAAADLSLGIGNIHNNRTVTRDDDAIIYHSTPGPRPDDGDDDPYEELKPDVSTVGQDVVGTGAAPLDGREYAYYCNGPDDQPIAGYHCRDRFGGTSAATPMTAGVVALMLSANPELTPAEIKEILHQTAQPHPTQTPSVPELSAKYNHTYGYGMTDAYKAVVMATQWPGMQLGRDTDADGVRDSMDAEPRNPSVSALAVPAGVVALGGTYDTDGDMVADAVDPAPLDPHVFDTETAAPLETESTPGIGLAPLVLALAGVLVVARRQRGRDPSFKKR